MWINKFKVKERYISNQCNDDSVHFLCGWIIDEEKCFIAYYDKRKYYNNGTITILLFEFINHFNKIKGSGKEQRIYFICG